jgi:hypothetical protein
MSPCCGKSSNKNMAETLNVNNFSVISFRIYYILHMRILDFIRCNYRVLIGDMTRVDA